MSLFTRDGERFVPSGHTRGPWDEGAMHGGAPAALIARAVEALETPGPMRTARLTIELLRPVPIAPVTVTASIMRPGRKLQVAEAVLAVDGTACCVARAVRLSVRDVDVEPSAPETPIPGLPDAGSGAFWQGEMFPATGMDVRFAEGSFDTRGPAIAWFRPRMALVDDEPWTPLQRVAAAADFGNGISRVVDWETHVFVNPDLSIHLQREPVGEWVALQSRTDADPTGIGQATSVLHDERGRIGSAAQSLFVDHAPKQ